MVNPEPLRDYRGKFDGARANLESVPRLPARAVGWALEDPGRGRYLLVWRRDGRVVNGLGEIVEMVRVTRFEPAVSVIGGVRYEEPPPPRDQEWASVTRKRWDPGNIRCLRVIRTK